MDIIYIAVARGFVFLAVALAMEAAFCVETLEHALARHGRPEIFNTDQSPSSRLGLHRSARQQPHRYRHEW
jgi:hypothetical protein